MHFKICTCTSRCAPKIPSSPVRALCEASRQATAAGLFKDYCFCVTATPPWKGSAKVLERPFRSDCLSFYDLRVRTTERDSRKMPHRGLKMSHFAAQHHMSPLIDISIPHNSHAAHPPRDRNESYCVESMLRMQPVGGPGSSDIISRSLF